VVALRNKAFVYNFADLQLLDQVETADNPKGIARTPPRHKIFETHTHTQRVAADPLRMMPCLQWLACMKA